MSAFSELIDAFLHTHWTFHPIDASFAGETAFDELLPPADAGAPARERAALRGLRERLERTNVPDDTAGRIDSALMRAQIAQALDALDGRSGFHNPAWYTGEAAFALIALLLRDDGAVERPLRTRLDAIPDFLGAARAHLAGRPIPADWITRARNEVDALLRLLDVLAAGEARLDAAAVDRARAALRAFDASLDGVEDADPACGEERLALLVREVHGLDETPRALERRAAAAFDALHEELIAQARGLDPHATWREQLERLATIAPGPSAVLASYDEWHERALRDALPLVTGASEYGLTFAPLPQWAREVAADLYFLFYRSPPAYRAGAGSTYWVTPVTGDAETLRRAHPTAAVKTIHAVHHGSIGHHTQNARARSAPSRLARVAGTDCASGIAFLAAGTMVEGWACYAEELLAEIDGFYTPAERLQLTHFALRNAATTVADIRLHTGDWTLAQVRRFYRDEVGFAPARIWGETTRNSMFPASRLMYWTGTDTIRRLRRASRDGTKTFHDRLLSLGSAPVAALARELQA